MFDRQNDTTPDIGATLASNLRRLRVARHLSLSELARATGIGKATLSAIESGNANPTVGTLTLLAGALRVRLGELVEEPPPGEIRVLRAREQRDGSPARTIGAFEADGSVELRDIVLPARETHAVPARAPGARDELLVLQGTIIAGPVERPTELSAGDYASFPADVERHYEAGRRGARALLLTHG